jgi:hyperosmotically inducible protein
MARLKALVYAAVSLAITGLLAGTAGNCFAQTQDTPPSVSPPPQGSDRQPTADQAGQGMTDREIMQKIRQAIVGDDTLSTYAQNVKIVAKNGKVTLRGPVRSEDEKQKIQAIAANVVGETNVMNDLTIQK